MAFDPPTKENFLELWRRIFPDGFTDPIETVANGQGFDVPSLQAAIFERASDAIATSFQAYYLKPHSTQTRPSAAAGAFAVGTIEISRTAPADSEITLQQGVEVVATLDTSTGGVVEIARYRLTEDVVLASGDLGPVVASVRAIDVGYTANIVAGKIQAFVLRGRAEVLGTVESVSTIRDTRGAIIPLLQGDHFTEGQPGQYISIQGLTSGPTAFRRIVAVTQGTPTSVAQIDPPLAAGDVGEEPLVQVLEFEDLGLTIEQPDAILGGVTAMLDAIARDRGQGRVTGEGDQALCDRLVGLEDIISPAAIRRAITRILSPLGINFVLKETRDVATLKGFVFDVDPWDFGSISAIPKVIGSELVGDGAVWLSEGMLTRFFIICVGPGNQGEFGGGYDTPMFPDSNAWDFMAWDGFPVIYNSLIGQVAEVVDRSRAAGVSFVIVKDLALA